MPYFSFRGGHDDMFSSDLDLDTLKSIYSKITTPIAVVLSGNDEYVPSHVNPQQIILSIGKTCPGFRFGRVIEGADHNLSQSDHTKQLCEIVKGFVLACKDGQI